MQIFIKPEPVRCLSFDLDDTLYDNRPVMRRAEAHLLAYLNDNFSATETWHNNEVSKFREQLLKQFPEFRHDLTLLREKAIAQALIYSGYGVAKAHKGAKEAMSCFLHYRSAFKVSNRVIELLQLLSQRYVLIAITNGNADFKRIGLDNILAFGVASGRGLRMKPFGDMFHLALNRLKIDSQALMHIGDSYSSDVCGARQAGCQAVWLSPAFGDTSIKEGFNTRITTLERQALSQQSGLLPHIRISRLEQLTAML